MTTASTAETFITAIYNTVGEAAAGGNSAAAIERLDTYIESIEDNDPKTRNNFGSNLMVLYCMRARFLYEAGDLLGLASNVELAQADIARAEARLGEFYIRLSAEQREQLRAQIRGVISSDPAVREASMAGVQAWKGYHPVMPSERLAALANDPHAPHFAQSKVGRLLIPFLVGAAVWVIPAMIILTILKLSPGGQAQGLPAATVILMLVIFLLDVVLAYHGWDWMSGAPFGSSVGLVKYLAIIGLVLTVIGLPLVMYWSGKKLLYAVGMPYFS